MKRTFLAISILCICFSLNCYPRGGFRMSSHSFHFSKTGSHAVNGKTTSRTVSPAKHINAVRTTRTVETGFYHSARPATFYHNNPSYRMVNNYYYPVYYRSPNYLFWYFVILNPRTHRNDTVRAKSKDELDKKVKSISTSW